ncbi:hypothetical protein DNTS_035596 [Danionella cerebrum]|uniref:Propionate--CoA ligase n=1 Tax=Danionella cerebrum TaxID=2873325 RepID=A0A553NKZ7_9TELE|nr:hypothetical protein DNTS_035596 [Danionella translucida]
MSPVSESSGMEKEEIFLPPEGTFTDAHVPNFDAYQDLYKKSIEQPEEFWGEVAQEFFWRTPPSGQILQYNFDITKGSIYIRFMEGARTNICYNILDRNVYERNLGEKVAYYCITFDEQSSWKLWSGSVFDWAVVKHSSVPDLSFSGNESKPSVESRAAAKFHRVAVSMREGNSPDHHLSITYKQLLRSVSRCANALKLLGVKKGDRVAIYLPMIPELIYSMLACARIGAVHSVVFAGFSSESLCERITDAQCNILVTADGVYRGDKLINLKKIASEALERCRESQVHCVQKCVVVRHHAFITNHTSNKLQGVVHTVSGYMLYTSLTFKHVFDYHHEDVYWCTADIGWITGHSYITYGPLSTGATSVLFEGVPVYPHEGRLWQIIEKYGVSKFYTAPTAVRLLMKYGTEPVQRYNLSSLRVLGSVGEPINPEAWHWFYDVVGQRRCPVIDTFWQTETGGHVLTPLPAATPLKPGSATFPFFGVQPAILNEHGEELEGEAEGYLVFRKPWPGIMRTVFGNKERFESTYFRKFPGFYMTGDGCRRDKDGYYWITGRIDDMLNVSGHLLSSAEVEAALSEHSAVAEAAVVSRPHALKGECLYCFITLKEHTEFTRALVDELKRKVREKIGPIATPDFIQNAPGLPKTRSGKIMRRVLRQIARNEKDLGDLSTLADPKVVEVLFSQRCQAAA